MHGSLISSIVLSRLVLCVLDVGWCEASEARPQICEELAPVVRRAGLAAGGAPGAQGCDSCRTLQPHLLAKQLARMQQARHTCRPSKADQQRSYTPVLYDSLRGCAPLCAAWHPRGMHACSRPLQQVRNDKGSKVLATLCLCCQSHTN